MNEKLKNLSFFPAISLVVTNACRMRCQFCCAQGLQQAVHAKKEDILKILEILAINGTKRISFSGGDPLVCPFLKEYVKKAYDLNMTVTLMTSDGIMLNKLDIPSEYFDTIWISVHGLKKEHEEITLIENSFSDLETALKNKINKYPLGVWSVTTRKNSSKVEELVDWCIENKVKRVYFSNISAAGYGKQFIKNNGRLTNEEFALMLKNLREKYEDKIIISGQEMEANAQCILILGNGDVCITPYFESENNEKCIGNLFKQNPKDIFENLKQDEKVWEDYISRLSKSSMFR